MRKELKTIKDQLKILEKRVSNGEESPLNTSKNLVYIFNRLEELERLNNNKKIREKEEIIWLLGYIKSQATQEREKWLKDKDKNTLEKCVKLEEKFELLCWVLNEEAQKFWDNLNINK